ncbi:hypothetical protein [Psychromonas sp.]|uniref:hypothetical protein n=1 Tax=Psychromonas sp. TaxID=1884585 RepID=UPI0035639983
MFNSSIHRLNISGLLFILLTFSASGYADDVQESINEALQYYNNGEYKDAVDTLNYASQLIQQKRGGGLELFLPEPLAGWTVRETGSQAMAAAMFGGGISAEREYSKGSSYITVQIITDSPLMQGMMMMFSNPMYATSDGGKLERIGRQKAIVKYQSENKEGDINMVVANRFLVTIAGQRVTREELIAYAEAIDYKKLQSLP